MTTINRNVNSSRGLVKAVLLVIFALLLLSYLGFNLREIINSQTFTDNWQLLKEIISTVWNDYLKGPAVYLWSKIFLPYIWDPIITNIKK